MYRWNIFLEISVLERLNKTGGWNTRSNTLMKQKLLWQVCVVCLYVQPIKFSKLFIFLFWKHTSQWSFRICLLGNNWSWEGWGNCPELHGELLIDLKRTGITVTELTISNTHHRLKITLLKWPHLGLCKVYHEPFGWSWGE